MKVIKVKDLEMKRISGRSEILDALRLGDPRPVDVDGIGLVLMRKPSFKTISDLRMKHEDKTALNVAIVVSACVDLMPEDVQAILDGDPNNAANIVNAVLSLTTKITDEAVGKPQSALETTPS
jgi:hypothetical protein